MVLAGPATPGGRRGGRRRTPGRGNVEPRDLAQEPAVEPRVAGELGVEAQPHGAPRAHAHRLAVVTRDHLHALSDAADARRAGENGSGEPVGVRSGRVVGLCFHPELTRDLRFHSWFLTAVAGLALPAARAAAAAGPPRAETA